MCTHKRCSIICIITVHNVSFDAPCAFCSIFVTSFVLNTELSKKHFHFQIILLSSLTPGGFKAAPQTSLICTNEGGVAGKKAAQVVCPRRLQLRPLSSKHSGLLPFCRVILPSNTQLCQICLCYHLWPRTKQTEPIWEMIPVFCLWLEDSSRYRDHLKSFNPHHGVRWGRPLN